MKEDIGKQIKVFGITLGLLLVALAVLLINVYQSNHEVRELYFPVTDVAKEHTDGHCAVTILPRGGSTDAWIREFMETDESGEKQGIPYAGIIYEVMVTNQTSLSITDWTLQIIMPKDCFINNAWCGQLEFHQHMGEEEKEQTIDLRKWDELGTEILLDYFIEGTDLMIPMDAGDYFVYIPSAEDREAPILPSTPEMENYQSKRVGFIAYHRTEAEDLTPMKFSHVVLQYRLQRDLERMPVFWGLMVLFLIWFIAVVAAAVINAKMHRLLEIMRRDAETIEQTMSAFMGFIDAKDVSTNGHSIRVAQYTRKIAQRMGFDESECDRMYYIGLMHDCGKMGIPDAVLCKASRLTDEEYEIIKTHTTQGDKILREFTSVEGIRDGVLYHHERYDGKGYPTGLKGEEIPLVARIICVADSFDAMNSNRCYRKRLAKDEIMEQLQSNKGTQFDPKLVDILLGMLADGTIVF